MYSYHINRWKRNVSVPGFFNIDASCNTLPAMFPLSRISSSTHLHKMKEIMFLQYILTQLKNISSLIMPFFKQHTAQNLSSLKRKLIHLLKNQRKNCLFNKTLLKQFQLHIKSKEYHTSITLASSENIIFKINITSLINFEL